MGNAILRRSRRACSMCNAINLHSYTWNEDDSSVATCVTEGYDSYVCDKCGDSYTSDSYLDPDNHEDVTTTVFDGNESTCVTHGVESTWCQACNAWIEDNELDLDPDNHEAWVDGGDGVEGHCTACGAVCDHEFENVMIEGVGERSYCVKCGYYDV